MLKAEIERKRKATAALVATDDATGAHGGGGGGGGVADASGKLRFIRQGDLMKAKEKELEESQRRLDEEKEAKRRRRTEEHHGDTGRGGGAASSSAAAASAAAASSASSSSSAAAATVGASAGSVLAENPSKKAAAARSVHADEAALSALGVAQVKGRLRGLGEPITLFGETNADRVRRLAQKENERANSNVEDEFRIGSRKAGSNSNSSNNKAAEEEEEGFDEDDLRDQQNAVAKKGTSSSSSSSSSSSGGHHRKGGEPAASAADKDDDSDEDDDEDDRGGKSRGGGKVSDSNHQRGFTADGQRIQFSALPNLTSEKVIYKYFRAILKQWEWDLNARSDVEKMTAKGKMDTKTQKQCKDYIRPLFKMCKRRQVEPDILEKLLEIVKFCEAGNFRAAHDIYLQTAIGNAAWPIGATMVGIHARSAGDKISTSKVAHVMNNELQRKYLTSVKRLMTFAQKKRPDVPPSMKVL